MATSKKQKASPRANAKKTRAELERQNSRLKTLSSALVSRAQLAGSLGFSYGTDRDLYAKLGYPKTITYDRYLGRYLRQDIANRVINAPVDGTWRMKPQVIEAGKGADDDVETTFEKTWKELSKRLRIYNRFTRADKLAGIGSYSVLYIGFDDNADPSQEVGAAKDVLFLHPYSSDSASIVSLEQDPANERYGLPTMYQINMSQNTENTSTSVSVNVHWTRVLHIAEGMLENNVYGTPRLEKVWNRLQDLETLAGGSAEMFWRGAFTGMVLNMQEDADVDDQVMADLADEMDEYIHGLRRYIRTQGMDITMLNPTVADPSKHAELQFQLISAATGIPVRILTGSERGELASSQDESNWHGKIKERQEDYANPYFMFAFIDRLIELTILPEVEYEVVWPDMMSPSEKEQADIMKVKTDALVAYANSPSSEMVMPLEIYLAEVWGMDKPTIDRLTTIVDKLQIEADIEMEEEAAAAAEDPDAPKPPFARGTGNNNE